MPKKSQKNGSVAAPLPAVDESYVQAMKIQMLEERNAALKVIARITLLLFPQ
jgi:hypothetical protein